MFDIFICGILDVDSYFLLHLIGIDMSSRSPALCVCVRHAMFSSVTSVMLP